MTMTAPELEILHKMLSKAQHYLEFGSGKSTEFAVSYDNIKTIDCIESDPNFLEDVIHQNELISSHIASGRVTTHPIDIGATGEWGFPVDESPQDIFTDYSMKVHGLDHQHDTILVDGRFRVACVLEILAKKYHPCNILIHDFWHRNEYHAVLNFLDVQASIDSMGVFTPRQNIDLQKLEEMRESYRFVTL